MHAIIAGVLAAILLQGAPSDGFEAVVSRVVDGDTLIVLREDGRRLRVRLVNIDAPESRYKGSSQEPWASMAARRLARLAPKGSRVRVSTPAEALDRHGRTLGLVFRGETNVNLSLVREGLALPYLVHPAMGMAVEFAGACAEARREGRGLFAPGRALPEEPARFRLRLGGRAPYWWVGNLRTGRYGPPESFGRHLPEERILFENEERAIAAGYAREE
ncbi:MAG TPA: thermonuclease family protein [Spirochaetota bacterium]|nr:thermonuclease family protein [Spirochaetota bacterium]